MKKIIALISAVAMISTLASCTKSEESSSDNETKTTTSAKQDDDKDTDADTDTDSADTDKTVGIAMPTKSLERWNRDGEYLKNQFEEAGYSVELKYSDNNANQQNNDIQGMIADKVDLILIAAIDGESLSQTLADAKAADIPVIAYDRLIMNTDAVSYYATFDNYKVGTIQGQYVIDSLDLDNAEGPFNVEFTTGDPGDNNANFFYSGAMDLLKPYIESGKINVVSGQTEFADVATASWATENAQSRAENILSSFYADGTELDAWVCSNDSTALGVANALAANYTGKYPIITGQDCDIANVKNILADKQSMSIFKDTRTLAAKTVEMVDAILKGGEPPINDTATYDNGKGIVPSFLCDPVFADKNNYKELLLDSGYYTEADLQ